MKHSCAGVILSGGLSSRMKGFNKAYLKIGNSSLIERILDTLKYHFSEILLVTRDPEIYNQSDLGGDIKRDLKIANDILEVRSPLTGIHAGLVNMRADYAFCIGCDTPFLKKEVVEILISAIEPWADVVVPFSDTYFQPLCAVYSKRCINLIEQQLSRGDPKVDHLFAKVSLKKIPYEQFEEIDNNLISFFNVNTPEDLRNAEQLLIEK